MDLKQHLASVLLGALLATGAGCDGRIFGPGEGPGGSGSGGEADRDTVVAELSRFPRLTHAQWENTVQDLFGLPQAPGLAGSFDADPPLGRFENNIDRLKVSSGQWRDYQVAAEQMAARVTEDESLRAALTADLPEGEARASAFVERFGMRAFRRPLAAAEIERYVAQFEAGTAHYPELDASVAGVRHVVASMLQSPFFIYRAELSSDVKDGAVALSGYEVATRLAYLLWNTMPDDALFAAAAEGALETAEGVQAQTRRMLDDPRTRRAFAGFHFQAYEMRDYADLDKSDEVYESWRRQIGESMQDEAQRFLENIIFDSEGSIADILTSTTAFVNADLAPLYGLEGDFGDELVEVELDGLQRAGILTRLGFLAKNATARESDPIHRGVFINLNILCRPLSAVPNLPDDLMAVGDTNRERVNSLTGPGTCGEACHGSMINPVGFALEGYDAVGRFRTEESGLPVNAADTYEFADGRSISFQDGVDLSWQLAEAPEVHSCYISHLFEYATGRGVAATDAPFVDELTQASLDGAPIRELVERLVQSRVFRFRAAPKTGA